MPLRKSRRSYKRKYQRYRQKYRRYKRAYRARSGIRRSLKRYVHIARQSATTLVPYSSSGGLAYYGSAQFQLNSMLGYSQFTAMFQEYRINCVVYKIQPLWDCVDLGDMTLTNMPNIGYCLDYNDANIPTNLDDLQQYANYKETPFNKTIKIKVWPAISPQIYINGVTSGYTVKRKQWLRAANSNVPHYGLKFCIFNIANDYNYKWNVSAKFYVSFRAMW